MTTNYERLGNSEYRFIPSTNDDCQILDSMKADFDQNSFIIVRDTFDRDEIEKLNRAFVNSEDFKKERFGIKDKEGLSFYQAQWKEVGSDVLGMATRTRKVADAAEQLLDRGELYLFSGKVIMKQEHTGGSLIWHQDYGFSFSVDGLMRVLHEKTKRYWYNNLCLRPDFVMCFIALTKNDRENGGLQVLKGSHLCGRIDHKRQAGQTGADLERVAMIEKTCERVYCDLRAGDVIFFHANTLHHSPANDSEWKRWNLILSFNARSNSPLDRSKNYNNNYEPSSTALTPKVGNSAVRTCTELNLHSRTYLDPSKNHNVSLD